MRKILYTIIISGVTLALIGIVQYIAGAEKIYRFVSTSNLSPLILEPDTLRVKLAQRSFNWCPWDFSSIRAFGTFSCSIGYSAYLGLILPISIGMAIRRRWVYLATILIGIGVLLSFTRSAWLGALISGGVMLILGIGSILKFRVIIRYMLIMATCILTIYLLLPGISYQARDRIYRIFVTKDLSERIKLWVAAIEIIKARPILGVGVANYGDGRRRFAKEDPKLPAHSNYLQIGAEMGLLGLFAFLWIAIGGVLSSFWIFRGSPNEEIKLLGLGFLGLWIWFLVQSQFATYYDSTKFSMLFWLLAGLNMSLYRTNSRNS